MTAPRRLARAALFCLGAALLPVAAGAADIRFAVRTGASSIDPHYHVYVPNCAVQRHIFDALLKAAVP